MRRILPWCLLSLAWPLWAASPPHVQERMLDNGMKVIVKEDHRAPIGVTQVWYRVGASYEPRGITGVSHALEHMMFKGTEKHGPNQFSQIIADQGGQENAFTGDDYTAYFQTLASDRLEIAFELEADRMRNLLLKDEEFAKEIRVVREERRLRTEDKPKSLTYEQFNAAAYRISPYRNPVIGWMTDLENMRIEDLRDWYGRWYSPNNATLVVVGDVAPERIFQMANTYFGKLKPSELPRIKPESEPPQLGETRIRVKAPAQQPYLLMGYKTPVVVKEAKGDAEWEPYALEMLAAVLDGGGSARFARELIRRDKVAVAASASFSAFSRLPGLLMLDGVPAEGQSMADLEKALRQQIDRLKKEPVSEKEMERVRNQLVAAKVYERDSVFYQAMQIGMMETIGLDWRMAENHVERMKQITPEQVMKAAQKYLSDDNLTLAELDPQPIKEKGFAKPMIPGVRHDI
ncbi:MAG: insulinase family protein [Gammaproteobacteria bacterium]|nr:insulinase family protein [Gammaproteobacteria bacterium]MBU1656295.1 insulinase family protein [Gammaproteobacteria bacterium]MBU1959860.1 insulinase family protein [Gammaproteobacteria bacterium]